MSPIATPLVTSAFKTEFPMTKFKVPIEKVNMDK